MPESFYVSLEDFPPFARALQEAAPKHLVKFVGEALANMGRSDIAKMEAEQLSGGSINIRRKGLLHAFKSKTNRAAKTVDQLSLEEYTGAKPFRIFQTGGDVVPYRKSMMTVMGPGGLNPSGTRKYDQKTIREMLATKQARIIQTKVGPAIVMDVIKTKKGTVSAGTKSIVIAWLKPAIMQKKRIDFFANFEANSTAHDGMLEAAMDEAIEATIAEKAAGA